MKHHSALLIFAMLSFAALSAQGADRYPNRPVRMIIPSGAGGITDIIGRNFRQPEEGLGFDNSPSAHMWRSMIWPNNFL